MEARAMHPSLRNHVVLNIVFDYLKFVDLKQCRLVMKHWDNLATPFLLSKCVIALNADETENLTKLRGWMESSLWFASAPQDFRKNKIQNFKSINCDRITHRLYPNLIATRVLGPWIRSFTVSHWWGNEEDLTLADYEDLLLRRCPNLEEINIPASHKFKAPNAANFLLCAEDVRNRFKLRLKTIIVTGMDDEPDIRFWRIMALSPELKFFKVTCLIHETFWKPQANLHFNAVMNLEKLEVVSYGNESATGNSANFFCETPRPKLASLTCEWYSLPDQVMMDVAHHVASTLTHFHVVLFNKICPDAEYDVDTWMIPKSLTKLDSFVLEIDDHCKGPIFSRTLIASIFLPKLKALRMKVYDDEDKNVDDWPSGLFGNLMMHTEGLVNEAMRPLRTGTVNSWRKTINPARATGHLRRDSFKVLELPPKFKDVSCIERLLDFYPNLSELTIKYPEASVVNAILQLWTQLQRFTLCLKDGGNIIWTNILTGGYRGKHSGTLADMKRLQSLDLKLIGKDQGESDDDQVLLFPFTDELIFKGLIFLPNVQHVSVQGHLISPEAIEALRRAALPFCYIDITQSQKDADGDSS